MALITFLTVSDGSEILFEACKKGVEKMGQIIRI